MKHHEYQVYYGGFKRKLKHCKYCKECKIIVIHPINDLERTFVVKTTTAKRHSVNHKK